MSRGVHESQHSLIVRSMVAALEHAPLGVVLLDAQLRLCGCNRRAEQLLRERVPPIGGELRQLVQALWPDANASELAARFEHTFATGEAFIAPPSKTSTEAYEWQIQRIGVEGGSFALVCYCRDVASNVLHEFRYRTLFESIDEGVALVDVVFDADGHPIDLSIVETNAAFDAQATTLGLAGRALLAWLPTFERDWIEAFGRVARTGERVRLEGKASSTERWFEVLAARVGDGRRIGVVFKDVSERKRAEAALRASEERHAFLLKLSDALRSLTDPVEMQFVAARVLGTHLGVSRATYAEVESSPDGDYYVSGPDYCAPGSPSVAGRFPARGYGPAVIARFASGTTLVVDDVRQHPDTRDQPEAYLALDVEACVAVPLIKRSKHVALITASHAAPRAWTAEDIALVEATGERTWAEVERARAEAQQRETEARLHLALNASDMGTFVWHVLEDRGEPDARTLALFGLPPTDSINFERVMNLLIHDDDRERLGRAIAAAMDPAGAPTVREDFRVVHADGSVHWVAATGRMVFDEEAQTAVRLVGMLADVTERKSFEATLREREEQLRASDRRKDEFIAILAHELRAPLAPLRTGLELLRIGESPAEELEGVRAMMERQLGHMVRLVDDLLDVSRIRSGKIRLRRQPTSLATLVHVAVDANRAAINERHITLRIGLPEELPVLNVDPTRFVQILSNLLNNAVKFTDPRGQIEIKTSIERAATSDEQSVAVTVADTGVGMSREMLSRVFELFAQGDGAQQSQGGLGIGLSLARRLVELHGGTIEASSEGLGRGSSFTVRLPLRTGVPDTRSAPATMLSSKRGRRVVVIDDNVDAANSLKMFVTALGGECRVAFDGTRGLETVLEFRPELVLLDLGMPHVDGFETCRQIRRALGASVSVVAITGWGQEQDKKAASRAWFDAHLTKPVDPNVLKMLLERRDN